MSWSWPRSAPSSAVSLLRLATQWLSPHEFALTYGKASAILSKRDADLVAKLCECGKAFLHLQATNLVHKYMDDPIALSYSSDSTPLTTTERFAIGRKDLRAHRRGGPMCEYLV